MTSKSVVGTSVLASILSVTMVLLGSSAVVKATDGDSASGQTTFNVNVHEILSVSITRPDSWASGNTGDFLRNTIGLSVTSNNGAGFTASMKTKTGTTALTNKIDSNRTIATLSQGTTKGAIKSDNKNSVWGYSLGNYKKANSGSTDMSDTSTGTDDSTYNPMSSSAITVLYSSSATSDNQDIYFGAKATSDIASGTYSNTVVISVVSGMIDSPVNPVDPVTPVTPPSDVTPSNPSGPTYDRNNDRTTRTTVADSGTTTTTTTEITSGNTTGSYAAPQGVTTTTTSDINEGTPLATGLAITAGVAAATGTFFFILAKRRKDDDEEDSETA